MSVTKILFKQSSAAVTNSLNTTIGEPLWHIDSNSPYGQLYVTNGDNSRMPTLIGPYDHAKFTIPSGTGYAITHPQSGDTTDQIVLATAATSSTPGYYISGFTVTEEGHIKAVTAEALPAAGDTVVWTQIENSGTEIATIKIGDAQPISVYAPTSGSSTGRNDELTASEHNISTADGSVDMYTAADASAANKPKVTLKHKAQNVSVAGTYSEYTAGSGTFIGFSVDTTNATNPIIEAEVMEINGGTWS